VRPSKQRGHLKVRQDCRGSGKEKPQPDQTRSLNPDRGTGRNREGKKPELAHDDINLMSVRTQAKGAGNRLPRKKGVRDWGRKSIETGPDCRSVIEETRLLVSCGRRTPERTRTSGRTRKKTRGGQPSRWNAVARNRKAQDRSGSYPQESCWPIKGQVVGRRQL